MSHPPRIVVVVQSAPDASVHFSDAIDLFDSYLLSTNVSAMSGNDAACALQSLVPMLNKLSFFVSSLGSQAVACNQHNVDGARGAAAWFASATGVSEHVAAQRLSAIRSMELNPDVGELAQSGELSFEKASLIARLAKGRVSVTEELLDHASSDSFESLKRRGHDLNAKNETSEEHQTRLRNSQYVNIDSNDEGMISGRFRVLPELAGRWLSKWRSIEERVLRTADDDLPRSAVAAQAFCNMLAEGGGSSDSGGSSRSVVNYHVRLEDWLGGYTLEPETCELAGVGLVPFSALAKLGEDVGIRLLLTSRNKLLWFSEANYSPGGVLPEFIKRAVKANQFHQCTTFGCVGLAEEVDHILARINGGENPFENLQGLCWPCHAAKTKKDAPWTAGAIYGRPKKKRSKQDGPPLADTG